MPNIYLGQWEWRGEGGLTAWRPPGDAIGSLDLRNLSQMGAVGGIPDGYGVFVYSAPQVGLALDLGTDIRANLTALQKSGLRTLLGTSVIAADRLDLVLAELFITKADVSGVSRWRPLMPQVDGRLVLNLGGFSPIWTEQYKPADHPLVLEMLRANYLKVKAESEAGAHRGPDHQIDPQHHLRVVRSWMRKYGIQPSDVGAPGSLPHRTVVSDDFNRADGELGANWTDDAGDADIVTNRWDVTTTLCISRYSGTSLSTDDHYSQTKVITLGVNYQGAIGRKVASGTQTYYSALTQSSGIALQIYKFVAGAPTLLRDAAITFVSGDTMRLECDGSTLRQKQNGTQRGADVTDTAIVDNLQCGITGAATDNVEEDFEAGDLAAGTAFDLDRIERTTMRGVLRGVGRGVM